MALNVKHTQHRITSVDGSGGSRGGPEMTRYLNFAASPRKVAARGGRPLTAAAAAVWSELSAELAAAADRIEESHRRELPAAGDPDG